jgi:hypothetical protein
MDMFSVGTGPSGQWQVDDIWFRGPPPYTRVKNMLFLRTGDAKALKKVGSNALIHNGGAELIVGSKKGREYGFCFNR